MPTKKRKKRLVDRISDYVTYFIYTLLPLVFVVFVVFETNVYKYLGPFKHIFHSELIILILFIVPFIRTINVWNNNVEEEIEEFPKDHGVYVRKNIKEEPSIITKFFSTIINIASSFIGGAIWGGVPAAILFANRAPDLVFPISMIVGVGFVVEGREIDLSKRDDLDK